MNLEYHAVHVSQAKQAEGLIYGAKTGHRSRKKCRVSLKRPYAHRLVHLHLPYFLKKVGRRGLRVVNLLLKHENNRSLSCVAFSQDVMAIELGMCRDTISEILRFLVGLGLLKSIYRHMKTSIYVLSNIFYQKTHRAVLSKFLPFLNTMLSSAVSDTKKILSSSSSPSSGIYKDYLVRDCARVGAQPENLGNASKSAILELKYTPQVCLSGSTVVEYYEKVARGKYMEKKFDELHQAIKSITEIDLSLYGKCKLTLFTSEVIQNARWNMRKDILSKRPIKDPFKHFYSLCEAASLKRQESIDYETFSLLSRKYKFLPDTNPLNSNKLHAKKITTKPKNKHLDYKSPPKEEPKTVQQLAEEYNTMINNEAMQEQWRTMPWAKQAWMAIFEQKMNDAKEREQGE